MSKRTFASVTEESCTCNYLQNAADDPTNPIKFDSQTAEFQFDAGDSMMVIYHCPFCGGAAPESKRALLFAQISDAEEERLSKLLRGVETINDAITKFGKPDFEGVSTSRYPERENEAPRIQHYRDIHYNNLSDVAVVGITERQDGKIFWQLQGKFIGANTETDTQSNSSHIQRP